MSRPEGRRWIAPAVLVSAIVVVLGHFFLAGLGSLFGIVAVDGPAYQRVEPALRQAAGDLATSRPGGRRPDHVEVLRCGVDSGVDFGEIFQPSTFATWRVKGTRAGRAVQAETYFAALVRHLRGSGWVLDGQSLDNPAYDPMDDYEPSGPTLGRTISGVRLFANLGLLDGKVYVEIDTSGVRVCSRAGLDRLFDLRTAS